MESPTGSKLRFRYLHSHGTINNIVVIAKLIPDVMAEVREDLKTILAGYPRLTERTDNMLFGKSEVWVQMREHMLKEMTEGRPNPLDKSCVGGDAGGSCLLRVTDFPCDMSIFFGFYLDITVVIFLLRTELRLCSYAYHCPSTT